MRRIFTMALAICELDNKSLAATTGIFLYSHRYFFSVCSSFGVVMLAASELVA
jgi:hypothetical protein